MMSTFTAAERCLDVGVFSLLSIRTVPIASDDSTFQLEIARTDALEKDGDLCAAKSKI